LFTTEIKDVNDTKDSNARRHLFAVIVVLRVAYVIPCEPLVKDLSPWYSCCPPINVLSFFCSRS
jgi:hypothetical protein